MYSAAEGEKESKHGNVFLIIRRLADEATRSSVHSATSIKEIGHINQANSERGKRKKEQVDRPSLQRRKRKTINTS